jgi:hypothetical protein
MIAAMMPEDRFSGIALAEFGPFAEVVHGPDLAFGESTDLADTTITEIPHSLLAFSDASHVTGSRWHSDHPLSPRRTERVGSKES